MAKIGTYKDVILSATDNEATDIPYWYIALKSLHGRTILAGIWFSREAAAHHFKRKRHRYPPKAHVYCGSAHMSFDMKKLYELARAEEKNNG